MATTNRKRLPWALLAVVASIAVVRLPSLSEPAWYSDTGFFTAVAWAMSKGLPLYSGVFDISPPGIYWFFRLLVALGAAHQNWVIQVAATALVLAATVLSYVVAHAHLPRPSALAVAGLAGLLLSVPTLDGDLLNVEIAGLPLALGALALAHLTGPRAAFLAGLLVAAAAAIRPTYLLQAVAVAVVLAGLLDRGKPNNPGRILHLALGALAGAGMAGIALALSGSLRDYLLVVSPTSRSYLIWANHGSVLLLLARVGVLGGGGVIAFARARSPRGRLAAAWMSTAAIGATLTPREFSHYVQEVVPAACFASAVLVRKCRRPLRRVGAVTIPLAALHLAIVLPAWEVGNAVPPSIGWQPNFTYTQLPGYYWNWVAYAIGQRTTAEYDSFFPGFHGQQMAVREVAAAARPGTRITVLGDAPWVYVETRTLPATRYLATNSAFWQVKGAPSSLGRAVSAATAGLILVAPNGTGWAVDLTDPPYDRTLMGPWPLLRPDTPDSNRRSTASDRLSPDHRLTAG